MSMTVVESEWAQAQGYGLDIDCIHSALLMFATCIVNTTRAIKRASEDTGDQAHIMNSQLSCGKAPLGN